MHSTYVPRKCPALHAFWRDGGAELHRRICHEFLSLEDLGWRGLAGGC